MMVNHNMYHRAQKHLTPNNRHRSMFQTNTSYENYNYDYWCETCDKGFKSLHLLEIHKQQHQKCNIDGCQFIAHPKVITKHIQMQHSTGLYKKIAKLDNPEEIKKWREERKRKYPTKENIEKKVAEIKEKIDRGEKMGMTYKAERRNTQRSAGIRDNQHKKLQQRPQYPSKLFDGNANTRKRPINVEKSEKHRQPKKIYKAIDVQEETRKLQPFSGIQNLILDTDCENESPQEFVDVIEDDEYLKESVSLQETINSSKPLLCGALTSLMCNYESSDEDDVSNDDKTANKLNNRKGHVSISNKNDNVVNCGSIVTHKNNDSSQIQNQEIVNKNCNPDLNVISQNETYNDSGPEEVIKTEQKENDSESLSNIEKHKDKINKTNKIKQDIRSKQNYKIYRRKLPSTLLEKLLHKEIQQERNIVLQCIRYIVKNNYFDMS